MRTDSEMIKLITAKAVSDQRIRAVLLNGSRVNSNLSHDALQDFDVVYVVRELSSFLCNHQWTDYFGEKLIEQLPDTMIFYDADKNEHRIGFTYLMLFSDGNSIDLTLYPVESLEEFHPESLSSVLLDKDKIFSSLPLANESDYLIPSPTQKEFNDVCNEFWWVSTYVAKGLARSEITYAKDCMENVVRPMLMKMLTWYVGTQTNFSVNLGKNARFISKYISPQLNAQLLATYADGKIKNNWTALFVLTDLFASVAKQVAANLQLQYHIIEEINVKAYLKVIEYQSNFQV